MPSPADHEVNRRLFLGAAGAALTLSAVSGTSEAVAADRPAVRVPRATSGDVAVEPDWDEKLTLLVGPKKGQIIGTDEKAIQAAVDYVARLGGGTVLYSSHPLQRRFRDAFAATQHMMIAPPSWELAGRVLMGLPTDASML